LFFKPAARRGEMSYSLTRGVWEVRWHGSDDRQRSRRFGDDERAAQAFDEAIHDQGVEERKQSGYGESGGVYPYETAKGTRWRCKVKRSDGTWMEWYRGQRGKGSALQSNEAELMVTRDGDPIDPAHARR
jgi:hypothetical protein